MAADCPAHAGFFCAKGQAFVWLLNTENRVQRCHRPVFLTCKPTRVVGGLFPSLVKNDFVERLARRAGLPLFLRVAEGKESDDPYIGGDAEQVAHLPLVEDADEDGSQAEAMGGEHEVLRGEVLSRSAKFMCRPLARKKMMIKRTAHRCL